MKVLVLRIGAIWTAISAGFIGLMWGSLLIAQPDFLDPVSLWGSMIAPVFFNLVLAILWWFRAKSIAAQTHDLPGIEAHLLVILGVFLTLDSVTYLSNFANCISNEIQDNYVVPGMWSYFCFGVAEFYFGCSFVFQNGKWTRWVQRRTGLDGEATPKAEPATDSSQA